MVFPKIVQYRHDYSSPVAVLRTAAKTKSTTTNFYFVVEPIGPGLRFFLVSGPVGDLFQP